MVSIEVLTANSVAPKTLIMFDWGFFLFRRRFTYRVSVLMSLFKVSSRVLYTVWANGLVVAAGRFGPILFSDYCLWQGT